MKFSILDDNGINKIQNALKNTTFNGCDYQYSYMCAWLARDASCICFAEEEGIIYVRFSCVHLPESDGKTLFLPPLVEKERILEGYLKLREFANLEKIELTVVQAPQEHVALLDNSLFVCEKFEDADEYLYSPSDLIELAGKKYHSKRNFITRFKRNYNYVFRQYHENDYLAICDLFNLWQEQKGEEASREEWAMFFMIKNCIQFQLPAAVLEVDGKIIAFTIGEITGSNVGIVHFEKADTSYEGAYAVINNEFAKKYFSNCRIINRQEDMGIEGLRKAKLSYYPVTMCEKWKIKSV